MACFLAPTCQAVPRPDPATGPTYHAEAGLRGIAPTPIRPPLVVGWRFKVGAPVSLAPIVYRGIIYAVSDRGEMIALGMDGVKHWATTLPPQADQEHFSTPPLGLDNIVLAGTDKGFVHAFDAKTGALNWKTKIGDDIYGALNWLEPEGTNRLTVLALSRNNSSLYRLALTSGNILWVSNPGGRSDCSPAAGNGVIVFGACDSALHFISPNNGAAIAKIEFEEHGPMAAGIAIDGTRLFAGTRDGSVLCADTTAFTILWTNQVAGNEVFTTPAVAAQRVLAGSSDGSLYCLNRENGKKIWSVPTPGSPASPRVSDNTVVITSGGTLMLLSLTDGKTLWTEKPCDTLSSPALSAGTIIVGTDDGFIILYHSK